MNWNIFFSRFKNKSQKPQLHRDLDHKLIRAVRPGYFPRWSQLKYFGHFLNAAEKRLVRLTSIMILLAAISWLGLFSQKHLVAMPAAGGDYSEAMVGQPKYINPLFSVTNDVDADLVALIYSGLFRYDQKRQLTPDLAASYKISDDKKIYDIALRRDIRWSDGEPFGADDVIYTFETIQNAETGSPLFSAFQGVTVEKTGDWSVRFTTKEPFAPFLNSLTIGILPEHIWGEIPATGIKLAKNNLQPIGTGAWKFSKLIKDDIGNIQTYSLVQNKNYYQPKPHLTALNFKFFSDYTQAIEAVRSQSVSAASFVPRQNKEKLASKNLVPYSFRLPQYTALFFNQNRVSSLKDADARRALAETINKKIILDAALEGLGEIIESPLLRGSVGYYPNLPKIIFNPDEANRLLDKKWVRIQPEEYFKIRHEALLKNYQTEFPAGKSSTATSTTATSTLAKIETEIAESIRQEMSSQQTFYRKDKTNQLLQITLTTADTPEYKKTAQVIADNWKTVGVQVAIQTVNSHQLVKDVLKNRNYQILLYGEIVGGDPDPFPFWHSSQIDYPGLNLSLFVNRSADALLEEARITMEKNKRDELYKKFQKILVNEVPAIFLYTPSYTFVANKNIRGIELDDIVSPSDRYNQIANWYVKTSWRWRN